MIINVRTFQMYQKLNRPLQQLVWLLNHFLKRFFEKFVLRFSEDSSRVVMEQESERCEAAVRFVVSAS